MNKRRIAFNVFFDGLPIVGAVVTIGQFNSITDDNGYVVFTEVPGSVEGINYYYSVNANGYQLEDGNIVVGNNDMNRYVTLKSDGSSNQTRSVRFVVADEGSNPLQDANVLIWRDENDKKTRKTNSNGVAMFDFLPIMLVQESTIYNYTVKKSGYGQINGTFDINEHTVINADLSKDITLNTEASLMSSFDVTFIVYDEDSNLIKDARVSLSGIVQYTDDGGEVKSDDGSKQYTNESGEAVFSNIVQGVRLYTVNKPFYFEESKLVDIDNHKTIIVTIREPQIVLGDGNHPWALELEDNKHYPYTNIVEPWDVFDTARQKWNSTVMMATSTTNFIYEVFNEWPEGVTMLDLYEHAKSTGPERECPIMPGNPHDATSFFDPCLESGVGRDRIIIRDEEGRAMINDPDHPYDIVNLRYLEGNTSPPDHDHDGEYVRTVKTQPFRIIVTGSSSLTGNEPLNANKVEWADANEPDLKVGDIWIDTDLA